MKLSNLSFTYQDGDEVILKDISLSFPNNGLVSLCGPSGSGKTTLLNIIAGFIEPSEGEIENTYRRCYLLHFGRLKYQYSFRFG